MSVGNRGLEELQGYTDKLRYSAVAIAVVSVFFAPASALECTKLTGHLQGVIFL